MAIIKAFKGLRPPKALAPNVAARPYDVLNSAEAREEVEGNPHSFLYVTKPEVDLPVETDLYSDEVYAKGKSNLERFESEGTLVEDADPKIYIYRQIWKGVEQYGLVVCSAIDDYFNDVIKKHEYTRPAKEEDRIKHMDTLSAHVGPVFITYPKVDDIDQIVSDYVASHDAEYDFELGDDVTHTLWVVDDNDVIKKLEGLFAEKVPATYIADGHHRAASSAKVGERRREANAAHDGSEDYNFFLSVLFPDNQLKIIDYNRVVKDLNGHTEDAFCEQIEKNFTLEAIENGPFHPTDLHEFGMYLNKKWYKLTAKEGTYSDDPIGVLDITILSQHVLDPVLGIKDQRTDDRIDFVGGIRGLEELERRVDSGEMKVAFSLYPVSIEQLISIADSGQVMPPKSTWFEPKLRSGLVSHKF